MKFEENLKRLETIIAQMESGHLSMDDMIARFEEGRALVSACQQDLESIRHRIEKVTKKGTVVPLDI